MIRLFFAGIVGLVGAVGGWAVIEKDAAMPPAVHEERIVAKDMPENLPPRQESGELRGEGPSVAGTTSPTPAGSEDMESVQTDTGSGRLDLTALPLGNQKYSSSPQIGYIYACNTNLNGGGAHAVGPWINEPAGTYDVTDKVVVDGSNSWADAYITISADGSTRSIRGNGLPTNHGTGNFPVSSLDDAYAYDRNPNNVSAQTVSFNIPANPTPASSATCLDLGTIGVALNGTAIFNGFDAAGRDAVAYEIQDSCDGHPERTGEYHYHSGSACFDDVIDENGHSALFGYALDGFGLYGKQSGGEYVNNSDLDSCHGHTHTLTWDGETREIYHYHLTDEYPYTLGCFKGTVPQTVTSPEAGSPQGAPVQQSTGPQGPPQEAVVACSGKSNGSVCSFTGGRGETVSGSCNLTPEGTAACVSAGGPPQ